LNFLLKNQNEPFVRVFLEVLIRDWMNADASKLIANSHLLNVQRMITLAPVAQVFAYDWPVYVRIKEMLVENSLYVHLNRQFINLFEQLKSSDILSAEFSKKLKTVVENLQLAALVQIICSLPIVSSLFKPKRDEPFFKLNSILARTGSDLNQDCDELREAAYTLIPYPRKLIQYHFDVLRNQATTIALLLTRLHLTSLITKDSANYESLDQALKLFIDQLSTTEFRLMTRVKLFEKILNVIYPHLKEDIFPQTKLFPYMNAAEIPVLEKVRGEFMQAETIERASKRLRRN
jgi:hypothetical protein